MDIIKMDILVIAVEFVVLLVLLWHLKELAKSSKDMHELIKEIHSNHAELHKDTKIIKDSVERLENDLLKVSERQSSKQKGTKK